MNPPSEALFIDSQSVCPDKYGRGHQDGRQTVVREECALPALGTLNKIRARRTSSTSTQAVLRSTAAATMPAN